MDDRLIELETKLAFQEATLEVLNKIITRQQDQIDQLVKVCRHLHERTVAPAAAPGSISLSDDIPPHY